MMAAVPQLHPERRGWTAAELFDMEFPPIKWVVEDYIAEGLTVLAGKPKMGKSWLALAIAIAVARGDRVLGDRKCVQGSVLYAALEDPPRRLKDRLKKLCGSAGQGAWLPKLTFWTSGAMARLDAGGLDQVRDWIKSNPDARLVIIDTLAKVRSGLQGNEVAYQADYREIGGLKALADDTGVAVVLVTHVRKMGADDPFDTVSGTLGITGAADTNMILTRDGRGVTLAATGRDIADIETALEWDKDACLWRVLGDAKDVRRSDARTLMLETLNRATEPMSPREAATASSHPYDATRYLLAEMAKAGEVKKAGRGKYLHPDASLTGLTASQNENSPEP